MEGDALAGRETPSARPVGPGAAGNHLSALSDRRHVGARPQRVEVIGPRLHHARSLREAM